MKKMTSIFARHSGLQPVLVALSLLILFVGWLEAVKPPAGSVSLLRETNFGSAVYISPPVFNGTLLGPAGKC